MNPQAPQCPKQLSEAAGVEWRRVVPILEAGGVVQQVDLALLVAYCETFSQWWTATQKLATEDVVDEKGKLNPRARYCGEQLKQLRGLLDQLGFTPASRKQILTGANKGDMLEDLLRDD